MTNLYESEFYDISYRAILNNEKMVKVFTDNDCIEVENDISFDSVASCKTSINYFLASIISEILKKLYSRAKKYRITVCDLEGKIKIKLKNPLTILDVLGYDEIPYIEECFVNIYLYSDMEYDELIKFCNETLNYCFIYNTLKNSMKFNIKFTPIV
ncbi:MAG: OsmC family peroxiredoxin [Parvimonas sp.]|uniref:OsmC family peroxiredoxin n=1 Tax=Parvimonas sp. TaxID=1944660 RepID=UPI0025D0464A|nr:OsmC family peroxiredoxin [Parvimonas sp.]MCI5998007.1 OsmC family peroxiredoxin [Parvimonas sp.]MDY3051383.1 OsmC family peroxiredoxin [Parvimonas sp.]